MSSLSRILLLLCCFCLPMWAAADKERPVLRADAPLKYTVQAGDTLWGIASRYLQNPWEWRKLWKSNKHIEDPRNLYPGDILTLTVADDPQLNVDQNGTVILSPRVRVSHFRKPIPTLPTATIRQFLYKTRVVGKHELRKYPYVLDFLDNQPVVSTGEVIYVRGICDPHIKEYDIFRTEQQYIDPTTKKSLGYEGTEVGQAKLVKFGDPSTLVVTLALREIHHGDRLLPSRAKEFPLYYTPMEPPFPVRARIVAVFGGYTEIQEHMVIAINQGYQEGFRPGYVLQILKEGKVVVDRFAPHMQEVKLPSPAVGNCIVFRTYPHISYALVTNTTTNVHAGDSLTNPV